MKAKLLVLIFSLSAFSLLAQDLDMVQRANYSGEYQHFILYGQSLST